MEFSISTFSCSLSRLKVGYFHLLSMFKGGKVLVTLLLLSHPTDSIKAFFLQKEVHRRAGVQPDRGCSL